MTNHDNKATFCETRNCVNIPLGMVPGGGGALNFFFGGCVPRRFQNVGSRERIFLEKWGSRERKFGKIWVYRAKILAKTWLKMQKFSKN